MSSPYQETCLPPRKLLRRRSMEIQPPLSINIDDDEDDLDLDVVLNHYSTDDFRMYEFKIRRCTRSRSHDWTDCPFAHPGEKARRRDPRRYHYSGEACPDFRRGTCPRGDTCEFAHGVFECWLHPARYRTHACKDGKNCKRKVCFFAHTRRQLRLLPGVGAGGGGGGCHSLQSPPPLNRYGGGCCCCGGSVASSPTSTLTPLSPNNLFSRFSEASCKTALLLELVSSLEGMGISALQDSPTKNETNNNNGDLKWGFGEKMMSGRSTRDVLSEDCLGGFNGPDLEWVNELVM